jgi:hypothetical protein
MCHLDPSATLNPINLSWLVYRRHRMMTRLRMPLPNINMPCPLLSLLIIIVLFHCRAPSPAQYALTNHLVPPPTYAVTLPGLNVSRDNISLIITQWLGLPPMYSHPTIPLSVHYALNLFSHAQKPGPFTLCSKRTRWPVLIAFSLTLILLVLYPSGDIEVNPGPEVPSSTPTPQTLSFVDFCNREALVSCMLTLEASSISLFYSLL